MNPSGNRQRLRSRYKDYDVHKLYKTIRGRGIGSEFSVGLRVGGYRTLRGSESQVNHFERGSFTANGRAAIGLAARYANHTASNQRNTVLLPAYLCHSMIQPFVELGLPVRFYPVASDLSINLCEVCNRIDDHTLAVMLMHYFGFGQPRDLANVLMQRFPHVMVIDDRTHMLLSDLYAGAPSSDLATAIYSPRKWGPFPDLGIVVWPRRNHSGVGDYLLDKGYDWSFGFWRLLGAFPRFLFFAWPVEALRRLSRWPLVKAEAILDQRVQIRRASPISRCLWRCWDWEAAWYVRRENYRYLLDNWPSAYIDPLFKELPESVCPLGFPIRTAERDSLKQYLISKGIFPPIHWQRPSEVPPDEFSDAATLAEQELTIPIDQRYDLRHMDYILEAVRQA